MAEKLIHEYKLIETEDGYRIEIKGDKEQIKRWMEGGGRHRGRGWRSRGYGPFGFPGMMFMKGHHGPEDFTIEIEEEDEEQETSED